ncbi:succinate dehydrogenase [ubiquinone] cytochrome b small subunit, mitochondrial [Bombyx mandarina]|uniref:Succinate dehydrogenase [ubiquinone] cytochrome b small subunit n=1 Tax=Bombyx mandarina TaxID=7092 RepID=A0A6J2KM21_BOMMA|nr:succinate dehydrogenase [ubiquinone] cytochrome b small subunit, mitochondrial [Bombyx mandarina]
MAFSMFLRTSGCQSRMFTQQAMRLATQPAITQRMISSSLPIRNIMKDTKTTPILNAIRSFRTSCVRRSAEKVEDHSRLWVIERVVSAALVPLIPLALMMPNKLFDSLLAILITAHSFWGLEAIAVDYVRASIFGPILPKIAIGLVYLISIATLGGLFYIISHDVGIANGIRQFWAIRSDAQKS